MKVFLSKKDVEIVNYAWKGLVFSAAIAMAVGAWIYNPGHLATAALIFAVGLESEIVKKDKNESR